VLPAYRTDKKDTALRFAAGVKNRMDKALVFVFFAIKDEHLSFAFRSMR
jgi:hypothetical protein